MDYGSKTREELIKLLEEKDKYIHRLKDNIVHAEYFSNINEKLINLMPEAVVLYKNRKVAFANEIAKHMFKQDLIDKNLGEIAEIYSDNRSLIIDKINKLLEKESEMDFINQKLMLNDESTLECDVGGFSFLYDGEMFLVVIFRDISEKKKIENLQIEIQRKTQQLDEAEEYSRLKSQLFATVSHELKTPLNVILGAIQLMDKHYSKNSNYLDSEFVNRHLKVMKRSCYRLLKLINNFIDMNKLEAGFFQLDLERENIVGIVEETTLSVVDYAKAKGIKLLFDTEVEEKILMIDVDKIERAMLNLLSNAIKFTEPGGEIEVYIRDLGNKISLSVKDTGAGIPKNMQQKIFDAFTRADCLYTRKAEGSGIGLSIVKSIVELHGGTIKVISELGRGSEFVVEIPVKLTEENGNNHNKKNYRRARTEILSEELSDIFTI